MCREIFYALSLSARRSQLNDPYDRSPVFISSPIHGTSHVFTYITCSPPPPHTTAPELRTVSHFYLRKTSVLPLTEVLYSGTLSHSKWPLTVLPLGTEVARRPVLLAVYMLTLLPKIFLIEDLSICHLKLRISPLIFKKFETALIV